ncbi:hypothetical protein Leryth_013866 [Lithospermum erythrorhizon]|nr:hypothetical protein Leryth_013866 [Lithospermum erythrorhizon]
MRVELAASDNTPKMEEDINLSDSELVFHVRNALKLSIQGECDSYNQLVEVIRHNQKLGPEEVALLVTCLKALSGAVSCINLVHHENLINAIFGMCLWNYSTDVMDALVELILSLAASSGKYVNLCLDMLVGNFVPPPYFNSILNEPRALTRKSQVLDCVHSTLKDIADMLPLSPMILEEKITERMPKPPMNLDPVAMVMYVENMLRLENGDLGPLVGRMMLVAIVDFLVSLDEQIPWDDIPEDDFTKGIFDMELGEFEGVGDDVEHDSDEMKESWIQKYLGGNKFAMKLDNLLVLIFDHLKLCCESGRLTQVFEILLQSFQKTVLPIYKSRFTQFVMFYACSLDPENCGKKFATMLLDVFMNTVHPENRMSAVAYLASYLSRAKFVSASSVATMLGSLVNWCSDYCKNQDGGINPKVHKVFYAGCQAIMYVLCFRMRSMVLIPRLKLQLQLLNIEEILRHPLSPLKVCLPLIVEEFFHVVSEAQLFTFPEMQKADGSLESELSRAFGGVEGLDMFFPFDPCLLKKSDSFIRPNYVYWSMVKSTPDDDEEEDDSDDDVDEAWGDEGIDMVDRGGRSFENHAFDDGFDRSFDAMSITPKSHVQ